MRNTIILFLAGFFMVNMAGAQNAKMTLGTNFWNLAWTGEDNYVKEGINWSDPEVDNVWNETFLEEIAMYDCIRFMDWVKTNGSEQDTWDSRNKPTEKPGYSGIAYEWMIDLCNRINADIWIPLPHMATDNYVRELALLIRDNLDPELKVYVEYSNEVWNFRSQQSWCKKKGEEQGFGSAEEFSTAMKYQVYRSAQIWNIFEEVWRSQSGRLIKVLSGQSGNSGVAGTQLEALDDNRTNPTGTMPDVYGIAPYFGGNGLKGNNPNVFQLLRKDILEKRWDDRRPARIENVVNHYEMMEPRGIDLVAYEGGQHIHKGQAHLPNRDPRMYDIYRMYLDTMEHYFTHFSHYVHAGVDVSNGNMWGAMEYTGQPVEEAHKYRALRDWIYTNRPPYMDKLPEWEVFADGKVKEITLTGINDNNQQVDQQVTLTATSEDPGVIPDPEIEYNGGHTASLKLQAPVEGSGKIDIRITIRDDGYGTENKENNQSTYQLTVFYKEKEKNND
jgi:hypothetical protein